MVKLMTKKNEPEWMKKGRERAEAIARGKIEKTQKEVQAILDEKAKGKEKSPST